MTEPGDTLLLDGQEPLPPVDGPPVALGRDPFEMGDETDPFLTRLGLERLEHPTPRRHPAEGGEPRSPRPPAPRSRRRRRRLATPRLSEVEPEERPDWLGRLLGDETRQRLRALEHLVEAGARYDRFGLSPETLRKAFPLFYALYKGYFRVKSQGHEHIPDVGPAILAGNHGGLLPFDGAMGVLDVALHTDPPRLPRAIVERWAGSLPYVNVFYARVGQVIGTRENFSRLLEEGVSGIRKPITQRYRLQGFHVGFVEQALRQRAPIVPVAFLGSDDQAPILYDLQPLARRLGLPALPITPTFPWLGPLGLLPYPVRYRIVYGEPFRFHDRFGPEAAEDAHLVRYLANQVRRRIQQLVDRNR